MLRNDLKNTLMILVLNIQHQMILKDLWKKFLGFI